MARVNDIIAELERMAPLSLAEPWDNVGLLVGDRHREASRLMTCLTLTPTTAAEAIARRADVVVVHHPLPFKPLARLTTESSVGRLLWELIGARVAVYSAHTAFDSAGEGINERLACGLQLTDIEPLIAADTISKITDSELADGTRRVGAGRCGTPQVATTLFELAGRAKSFLSLTEVRIVGAKNRAVHRIAIACGSGGSYLATAQAKGCDCLVTGEANFHACLEAEAIDMGLVLTGHYASERFAMERLAEELATVFPELEVWASQRERDPISVV
jgi:dinuclear metal center YbgI/SA1388 family protein